MDLNLAMDQSDDRLVFRPESEVTQPIDNSTVYADKWWVYVPDKGIMFFRRTPKSRHLAPQCNSNRDCAEAVRLKLYPWAELRHLPVVYLRIDSESRIQ